MLFKIGDLVCVKEKKKMPGQGNRFINPKEVLEVVNTDSNIAGVIVRDKNGNEYDLLDDDLELSKIK